MTKADRDPREGWEQLVTVTGLGKRFAGGNCRGEDGGGGQGKRIYE